MADVQNVITLGIGSAPGSIKFFILMGLDTNPAPATVIGDVTSSDASVYMGVGGDADAHRAVGGDSGIYNVTGSDSSG
jgi:hypothetical protein